MISFKAGFPTCEKIAVSARKCSTLRLIKNISITVYMIHISVVFSLRAFKLYL